MNEAVVALIKWEMAILMAYQKEMKLSGRDSWAEEHRLKELRLRLDRECGVHTIDHRYDEIYCREGISEEAVRDAESNG